jgi:hypothetical protein
VFDALVDREDRHVARATQASRGVEQRQVAQHGRRPVRLDPDLVDEVGAREVEILLRDALAGVCEQGLGLVAEHRRDVHYRSS